MSLDLIKFDELKTEITELVKPTLAIKVTDFVSAASAIEVVKQVREFSDRVEETRKILVGPLNTRVKSINEYAKSIAEPLVKAEIYLKSRLVEFEREQEKIREAARQQAIMEQKRIEEELRIKQEAERQALLHKIKEEEKPMFGAATESAEQIAALEQKAAEEQAVAKGVAAQKQWDIDQHGIKGAKKIWKCEVMDLELVPKEYLIRTLNDKAVLAMARAGVTTIPGVKVWQETGIAVGRNTYVPRVAIGGEG